MSDLMIKSGTRYRRATADEILQCAGQYRALALSRQVGSRLESPAAVRAILRESLAARDHEVFCALWLDTRHQLIRFEELFQGTLDGASVHPRVVVKHAMEINAAAVILAHNHPSGVSEPSHADELITTRLREALGLVDVRVLDHFIVAGSACMSFAERGLI